MDSLSLVVGYFEKDHSVKLLYAQQVALAVKNGTGSGLHLKVQQEPDDWVSIADSVVTDLSALT